MELLIIASLIIIVLLLSVIFRLKTKQSDVREINRDVERREADLQRSIRELTDRQHSFSEYQGQQHYDENSGWYSDDYIERDNQKVEYCNINNIPLLVLNKDNYDTNLIIDFYNKNTGG